VDHRPIGSHVGLTRTLPLHGARGWVQHLQRDVTLLRSFTSGGHIEVLTDTHHRTGRNLRTPEHIAGRRPVPGNPGGGEQRRTDRETDAGSEESPAALALSPSSGEQDLAEGDE